MATISGVKKTATLSYALFNAVLDKIPNKPKRDKGRDYQERLYIQYAWVSGSFCYQRWVDCFEGAVC